MLHFRRRTSDPDNSEKTKWGDLPVTLREGSCPHRTEVRSCGAGGRSGTLSTARGRAGPAHAGELQSRGRPEEGRLSAALRAELATRRDAGRAGPGQGQGKAWWPEPSPRGGLCEDRS